MSIPTSIFLTQAQINGSNITFEANDNISVTNSELIIPLNLIPSTIITDINISMDIDLGNIPVESNSTADALYISNSYYDDVSNENNLILIENNALTTLNKTTDYSVENVINNNLDNIITYFDAYPNTILNSAVLYGGYVYIFGGYAGGAYINTVYIGEYDAATGTVSNWTTSTTLPATDGRYTLILNNDVVYLICGTSITSDIYYAQLSSGGGISAWTTSSIPAPLSASYMPPLGIMPNNGYLYIVNAYPNGNNYDFYYVPINTNNSLGSWVTQSGINNSGVSACSSICEYNNFYYVVGGANGSSVALSTVYYVTVNTDGSLSSPTILTSLPVSLRYPIAVAYNNTLYVLMGYTGSTINNNVYSAPINVDGSIGSWTTQTLVGIPAYRSAYVFNQSSGLLTVFGGTTTTSDTAFSSLTNVIDLNYYGAASGFTSTSISVPNNNNFNSFNGIYNGNFIYIVCPYEGGGNGEGTNVIYCYNTTNNTWVTYTAPQALQNTISFIYNNTLYIIGGFVAGIGYINNIYYAAIDSSTGAIGSFTEAGNTFPLDVGISNGTYITPEYIYMFGFQEGQGTYTISGDIYSCSTTSSILDTWVNTGVTLPFSSLSNFINRYVIGNSSAVYVIVNYNTSDIIIYQAQVTGSTLGTFNEITLSTNLQGTLINITNINNIYCMLDLNYNGSITTYISKINDMTTWTVLSVVNNTSNAINSMYFNNTIYGYSSGTNFIEVASTSVSDTTFELSLTNSLSSIPTDIYYSLSSEISVKWDSYFDYQPLYLNNYSVNGTTVTYNFTTINNRNLIADSNYPLLKINTSTISGQIQTISINVSGYEL